MDFLDACSCQVAAGVLSNPQGPQLNLWSHENKEKQLHPVVPLDGLKCQICAQQCNERPSPARATLALRAPNPRGPTVPEEEETSRVTGIQDPVPSPHHPGAPLSQHSLFHLNKKEKEKNPSKLESLF